jgi:hypothetical protein
MQKSPFFSIVTFFICCCHVGRRRGLGLHQGDQIGRFFAYCAIVYFEQIFFENFGQFVASVKIYVLISTKWVVRCFQKLIWSPWAACLTRVDTDAISNKAGVSDRRQCDQICAKFGNFGKNCLKLE